MKLPSATIDLACTASRISSQLSAGPTQRRLQYTDLKDMLESLDRSRRAGFEP